MKRKQKYSISHLNNPVYEDLGDGKRVRLVQPFVVFVDHDRLIVPEGFVSDLASVPWLFRRVLPRFGPWNAAAIVHDYLYREGEINGREIIQREADEIMLAVMKYNANVPRRKAYAIYAGVRLGGFAAWNGYRRKDNAD